MNAIDPDTLRKITTVPLPALQAPIRDLPRTVQTTRVRQLLKALGLRVSVTTGHTVDGYIQISLPYAVDDNAPWHVALHDELFRTGQHTTDCPDCHLRWQAHQRIEQIITAAFPDLADRSDLVQDYFDFCLSIN